MRLSNLFLYLIPVLIWGSTWYAITFQLGDVDPLFSVSYRFFLAGVILILYCLLLGKTLKYSLKQHLWMALQGQLLFGLNYWMVYVSENYLTSALVAIAFSLLIFLNIFFSALLLGDKVHRKVIMGAILGVSGTVLIFWPEIASYELGDNTYVGIVYCGLSIVFASLGNITSAHNQKKKLPVIQTNAFGMLYGSLGMMSIALLSGKWFSFSTDTGYMVSLVYLSIFGSIIAFSTYLTLVGRIGPSKAAYVILVIPIIALIISTIFEGYQLSMYSLGGIALILSGNLVALRKN